MVNPYIQAASSIRLVIADDHPLFRKGLSSVLKQHAGIQIVGEVSNGKELVEMVQEKRPDVVITDVHMPVLGGIEATKAIKTRNASVGIVALSMSDQESTVLAMMQAGANGYLLKNADTEELLHAVYTVHRKGVYYCTTTTFNVVQSMASTYSRPMEQKDSSHLSGRDLHVIKLMCEEKCSKEIAATLKTTCRAVEGVRQRIQEKVGARNMIGIVLYAIRHGIFHVE